MNKFTRKDFLESLFDDYFRKREGFILVKTFRNNDKKISTRYFPNVEILAKEQYAPDQNVLFAVCPHENMKPEKANIRCLVALWAGLDLSPEGYSGKQVYFFGQAQGAKAVRSFPIPPSIIVESGRGLHLYWLLKQVTQIKDPTQVENVLKAINSYFKCTSPLGIDSIMRLPGTTNCKLPAQEVECRIKYINSDFRYDLEEFENLDLGHAAARSNSGGVTDSVSEEPPESEFAAGQSVRTASSSEDDYPPAYETEIEPDVESVDYEDAGSLMNSDEISSMVVGTTAEDSQTVVVLAEESADLIADEIVDKVVEKLADRLMEQLVDEIVEKLVARLTVNR